jgi:hypothetical protein
MMKRRLRIVGTVLAACGLGLAAVGLFRSYADEPGPWASLSIPLVVLSLVCLALGIWRKRDDA